MDVVFGLIPMMLLFGFLVVVVFIWMAKSGQFDDLDGAANSIFMDDEFDEELKKKESNEPGAVENKQEGAADGESMTSQVADKTLSRQDGEAGTLTSSDDENTRK